MAHPTKNALSSSSSQSEIDIPDERSHSNNVASAALRHFDRDCVTLSSSPAPSLSHEKSPSMPLGSASASLAQHQPLVQRQPLWALCQPLRLTRWPFSGSAQLLAASVWPLATSAWPLATSAWRLASSATTLSWLLR